MGILSFPVAMGNGMRNSPRMFILYAVLYFVLWVFGLVTTLILTPEAIGDKSLLHDKGLITSVNYGDEKREEDLIVFRSVNGGQLSLYSISDLKSYANLADSKKNYDIYYYNSNFLSFSPNYLWVIKDPNGDEIVGYESSLLQVKIKIEKNFRTLYVFTGCALFLIFGSIFFWRRARYKQ